MSEYKPILSERLEDNLKAVEWAREEQRKILNEKGERLAETLMEKITPLIIEREKKKAEESAK